jgi:hypothetical protein
MAGPQERGSQCSMNDLTIYDTFAESWWQAGSSLHLLAAPLQGGGGEPRLAPIAVWPAGQAA